MFCEDKKCQLYFECIERLDELPYCATKAIELVTIDKQHLKAEIASIASDLECIININEETKTSYVNRLRQLSSE